MTEKDIMRLEDDVRYLKRELGAACSRISALEKVDAGRTTIVFTEKGMTIRSPKVDLLAPSEPSGQAEEPK